MASVLRSRENHECEGTQLDCTRANGIGNAKQRLPSAAAEPGGTGEPGDTDELGDTAKPCDDAEPGDSA
ncbi:hypothetical protein WISP_42505 [Willisornis vidua]|uniref:Uncharacterized protein n=1 Tax=Willisornis vidua TaxID=1566151 RepID=A0ABQ9DHQ2_9PASS|nr:hypothetical protein WISP_42505 [Willisornis vidua]